MPVMRIYLITFIQVIFFNAVWCQVTAPIKKINGVEYYMHEVEKGQTLYSISRLYGVSVKQIEEDNSIQDGSIRIGQILKIKKSGQSVQTHPTDKLTVPDKSEGNAPKTPSYHIVQSTETVYSIAKKYDLTVEFLMDLNPEVKEGIKPGDKLRLKVGSLEEVTIKEKDDSSGMTIALLLPFYLGVKDSLLGSHTKAVRQTALEIFRGMRMATDSVERMGVNAKIKVYSFENNVERLNEMITAGKFDNVDVFIGPLFKESLEVLAKWAQANDAWVVCPVPITNKVLMNNPRIIKAFPSDVSLWASMARYVAKKSSLTVPVYVYQGESENDKKKTEAFSSTLQKLTGRQVIVSSSLTELIQTTGSIEDSCVLVIPSSSKSNFSVVNKQGVAKNVWLIGPVEWQAVIADADEDEVAISNITFHYPKSIDYRRSDAKLESWSTQYTRNYYTRPTEYSYFGYDILLALANYNRRGPFDFEHMPLTYHGLASNSDWIQVGINNGFENVGLMILESKSGKVKRAN